MSIEEIIGYLEALGGVHTLRPAPGDGSPEIAWGDVFFYYAPDGQVPARTQPFATIITKDYPGDTASGLNRPGAFRLNIHAGKSAFTTAMGHSPRESTPGDPSEPDALHPHPTYAAAGWLAVVNPGPRTDALLRDLLRTAHDQARSRYNRA
ncbi:DUF6194 family protein [Nocardia inohanensis]|uniref:DUF6194 family protein n=1 Tax=Nocardia inohanensis TaxID=209246 RepID=UPI00082AD50F|nr:DUF6194 family protein [Nocardia inohanensis]